MTQDEAIKLAEIVGLVDGGCSVCVRCATESLMKDFPEIEWKILQKEFAERNGQYWLDEVDEWAVKS